MIGDRIKQARQAAGLTLKHVVSRLADNGKQITAAGLSKYENNKSTPSASFLLALGKVLNAKSKHFFSKGTIEIKWIAFRKYSRLPKYKQAQIKAYAEGVIDKHIQLQNILNPAVEPKLPKVKQIRSIEGTEAAAAGLRKLWRLGLEPIESLIRTTEDHGCIVVNLVDEIDGFEGLSGWANKKFPVLVLNGNAPPDRRRYTIAHELGHLVMTINGSSEESDRERYSHRFAAALLVPPESAYRELGRNRRSLSVAELGILKQKYGLSMQGWVRRAYDLGIIKERQYNTLCRLFGARRWRKDEPYSFNGNEKSTRLMQMVLHALAEGIITSEKAEEFCPGIITGENSLEKIPGELYLSVSKLIKLPVSKRDEILRRASSKAEKDYRRDTDLTGFDAYGKEDMYDKTE